MSSAVQFSWIFVFKASFDGETVNTVFLGRSENSTNFKEVEAG